MARVTYGVLALAFATLVSGFFFRHSALPLLVSIGLSGVVFVLILGGWSRRLRRAGALGLDADANDEDELGEGVVVVDLDSTGEIEEIEEIDVTRELRPVPSRKKKAKPTAKKAPAKPRKKTPAKSAGPKKAAARKTSESKARPRRAPRPDDAEFMPLPPDEEPVAPVRKSSAKKKPGPAKSKPNAKAPPKPKSQPKAKAKAKPAKAKPKPQPQPVARRVVIVPGRDRYHLPGCRFADAPGARTIDEDAAKRRGFGPCSVCLAG